MKSAPRATSRPVIIKAAVAVVAVAAAAAVALAVAGSWAARVGVALAVAGGIAGVALMLKALRTQTEAHTAELREQARRAHDALKAQHERERETLRALDIRTAGLQDTITALRSHLEEAEAVSEDAFARLDEREADVARLEGRVADLDGALSATEALLVERTTSLGRTLGARTSELAAARDRIAELEAMVALYEEELAATPGAEVLGLPRRRTA